MAKGLTRTVMGRSGVGIGLVIVARHDLGTVSALGAMPRDRNTHPALTDDLFYHPRRAHELENVTKTGKIP